jgi:imidazolonepropionase-like amidohydrolase
MKKLLFVLIWVSFVFPSTAAAENLAAIKAKKVITVSGEEIANAVILIKGDKIEKVGKDIAIPQGYKLFDFKDKVVYPGLINPMTSLGLSGISSIDMMDDTREQGKYKPHLSAFRAFYPWSTQIPITRQFGTLIALTAPSSGTIPGKAAVVSLKGWAPEDMFIKKEAALILRLPESSRKKKKSTPAGGFSKAKKDVREFIEKAHKYHLRAAKGITQDYNPRFEAMKALWKDHLPVIMSANSVLDIKFAIKLGIEFKLRLILYGIYDGEQALKEIKASGFPVILSSMYSENKDWEDGCDKILRLPAALAKAGIMFSFSASEDATAFDLPLHAGRAVAYGLSPRDAVKALTLYPAEILGIQEFGSIAPGKMAHLIVTDGDILETSTLVKEIFVYGKMVIGKSLFQKEFERAKEKVSGNL